MVDRKRHKTRYPGVTYRESAQGRRYIVAYSDGNGDQRSKHLPLGSTLEDARTLQGKLRNGRPIPTAKTVAELLDLYLETRRPSLRPYTLETYEWAIGKHLKPSMGRCKVAALSPQMVANLIAHLKNKGYKTWTVKKILTPLQGAYQIAVREGWVTTSPVTRLLPHERPKNDQKTMRTLSSDDLSLLLSTSSHKWRVLFTVLAFSGLRISEALALTWEDIYENSLIVRSGKTRAAEREVILIPSVRRLLTEHRLSQPPGATLVFGTQENGSCGRREALRALHAAEERAGLPNYTLHELRHTFASILIAQGELPTLVAKQMGHADPSITMKTYAHLWEEHESVGRARERLQEAMGGIV